MEFFYAFTTMLVYIISLVNLKIIKLNFKNIIILALGNYVVICWSLLFIKPLGVPITLIGMVLYLNRISKEYKKNIMLVVATIFIAFISDVITGITILKIYNISIDELINNFALYFILHIVTLIVSFLISRGVWYALNKTALLKINHRFIKLFLINLCVGLFMIYIIGNIYRFSEKNDLILILNLILLIIYFSLVAYIAKIYIKISNDEIKYKYKEQEMDRLKEYIDMVETTNSDIRKFKHDYLNILATINHYVDSKDFDGFVKYFNESIMPESDDIRHKNISFNNLKNIKLSPIKGIISYKIRQAQELNIEVIVDVMDEIEKVNMNIVDLCRILGILLDNAREEAVMCENKIIGINIIKGKKSKVFVISNTCRSKLPPIYNMIQKGFSTKGDNRGLGLSNIQEIIYGEYTNVMLNTYIEEGVFKQELIIED